MKTKFTEKIIFGIFFVVGLFLICIGIGMLANSIKISEKAVTTTATISRIESYKDSDDEIQHRVYLCYQVDGENYADVPFGEYSSNMYEGKTIKIQYVPEKPGKPYGSGGLWIAPVVLLLMGLIFGAVGGTGFAVPIIKSRKQKQLLCNGKCLHATVERITLNTSYSVNGRHPYIVFCTYHDEYEDVVYRFKSGNIWNDPEITTPVGSVIDVYVNPQDYGKYYVDTEKEYGYGPRIVDYT
ncbi:MAG: DUF3592 domain-containing protein [Thermoflexaceae bacterium]|nr:DUF3592 domain-containing protein [Thermoflexaceae bacterium]